MANLLRIAVLVSGRGSLLQALISACTSHRLAAQIVGVFSDNPQAAAIAIAAEQGIPVYALQAQNFNGRADFDQTLFAHVDAANPELIVCAGFMRKLSTGIVSARTQRLINIHPALLPKHRGLDTHQRVLSAGDREHGASVHFVTPALDAGPVIAQTCIPVQSSDSIETLAARLLPYEHRLLVATIELFTKHILRHDRKNVFIDDIVQKSPLRF